MTGGRSSALQFAKRLNTRALLCIYAMEHTGFVVRGKRSAPAMAARRSSVWLVCKGQPKSCATIAGALWLVPRHALPALQFAKRLNTRALLCIYAMEQTDFVVRGKRSAPAMADQRSGCKWNSTALTAQ
ncbi:hypothetical protein CK497_06315 [Vreelandella alkaliphila]|uniref:Uncharacterized protein n=1 Tax=Vreelandella alkaliphila TaxID=272774 RepID=A0ABX4HJQ7_9GAMM|nr:hypothetical protein CK497_06315 [Halomonas humidisoli]